MDGDFMGKKLKVKITEAGKHYMKCQLIDSSNASRPEGVPEPLKLGQLSGAGDTAVTVKLNQDGHYHPVLVVSLFVLITSLLLKLFYSLPISNIVTR